MGLEDADVKAIDAVVNIWTPEALSHRPDWEDGFFARKLKATSPIPITLDAVACDFPELKLCGIRVGIPWHDEMIAMARKHENVYIVADAHSPKYWPESFVKYLGSYGRGKVLFGTDFPVLDFKRTVEEIAALGFKPEVRRLLLRDNALRVFGIAG